MQKDVPLVKQNVMKLELFILGGQRIDQKRKKGLWRGRREGLRKGAERGEREREKRQKGTELTRIRNVDTCLYLCTVSSRHHISPEFPTRFCSKALQQ